MFVDPMTYTLYSREGDSQTPSHLNLNTLYLVHPPLSRKPSCNYTLSPLTTLDTMKLHLVNVTLVVAYKYYLLEWNFPRNFPN